MKKYFEKKKRAMFPDIKDWTAPQNQWRYAHPNELNLYRWIFFHPSCYLLATLGTNVMTVIIFGSLGVYGLINGKYILTMLGALMVVSGIMALYKNLKNYKLIKDTTFYDLWMREY